MTPNKTLIDALLNTESNPAGTVVNSMNFPSRQSARRWRGMILAGLLYCALYPSSVPAWSGYSEGILKNKDTPEPVTPVQVDEWVEQAEKGDWWLMAEFAAAYLTEGDCSRLKHGHRCRAMAARTEAGRKFLFQIIDAPVDPAVRPPGYPEISEYQREMKRFDTTNLQEDFALTRRSDALYQKTERTLDLKDPACKDYIKYMSIAAENGSICAARSTGRAYATGFCVKEDKERAKYYMESKSGSRCPVP